MYTFWAVFQHISRNIIARSCKNLLFNQMTQASLENIKFGQVRGILASFVSPMANCPASLRRRGLGKDSLIPSKKMTYLLCALALIQQIIIKQNANT